MNILKKRSDIPRVVSVEGNDRLLILPGEDTEISTTTGRPIGREYWDVSAKLQYMDNHNISTSVISLANPWLDFLSGNEAESAAQELNDELQQMCEASKGRIFGFATLPVKNINATLKEIDRISKLKHIKGVILSTAGAGQGLDHDNMRDILHSIEEKNLTIFMHPHYGVGNEHFHNTGHTLFLALGFPFETTVAVSRLIVTGAMDRLPKLKLLIAHAGACVPYIVGRLDSCVEHDHLMYNKLLHPPSTYLKRMYFDAISYGKPSLNLLIDTVGVDRIMFGTDNPFFPPLHSQDIFSDKWPSTLKVYKGFEHLSLEDANKICSGNAKSILSL